MDDGQTYALTHPLNRADNPEDLPPLTHRRTIPGGNLLTIILAVDR